MTQRKRSAKRGGAGSFAYEGLDRVLHEKARLGILTALATRPDGILFAELKDLCALTDGNLSRHLQVLREADGNKSLAASILGIDRSSLWRKMKKYRLED